MGLPSTQAHMNASTGRIRACMQRLLLSEQCQLGSNRAGARCTDCSWLCSTGRVLQASALLAMPAKHG